MVGIPSADRRILTMKIGFSQSDDLVMAAAITLEVRRAWTSGP